MKIRNKQIKSWLDTTGMTREESLEWQSLRAKYGFIEPKSELAKETAGTPKDFLWAHRFTQQLVENINKNVSEN